MEFWGAVVESGEYLSVVPADCRIIHISQRTFGKQTVKIVEPEKDESTEDGDDDSGVDDLVSEDDEVETVEPVEEDKVEESNDEYSVYDADSEFDKADPPMEEGENEDGEETTEEPHLDRIGTFSKDFYIRRLSKRLAKNDELNRMANELLDFFGEDDLCCGIPNPNTQQPSEVVENFWKNEDFIKGLRRQISHYPFMATDLMCYAAEFIEESPEERVARINKNHSLKYFLNAVHPRFRMSPQYFVWVLDYTICAYRAVTNNTNERI
ncbi:hypothetical protein OROGR_025981 [Orobanche gracilis]